MKSSVYAGPTASNYIRVDMNQARRLNFTHLSKLGTPKNLVNSSYNRQFIAAELD